MSFRILRQVPLLQARYAQYQQWLNLSPQERQQRYAAVTTEADRASHSRRDGFVISFNTAGSTAVYLKTKILSDTQGSAGAALAGVVRGIVSTANRVRPDLAGVTDPVQINARKYKFAKLSLTTVSQDTSSGTSRITGVTYRKPDVDSCTSNFGGSTAGETYQEAVTAISEIAAFNTHLNGNGGKNRAKFTPEG